MEKEELAKIISLIKLAYPNTYFNYNENDFALLVSLWQCQFKNETYNNLYKAVMYHISCNSKPPTPSDIKEILFENSDNKLLSNEEAWEMVLKASRINRELAIEELKKLPDYIKNIVTIETLISIGHATKENLIYLKKDFLKEYGTIKESHKRNYQISSISNNIKVLESDDKKLLTTKL